jgi:hypothetical protein
MDTWCGMAATKPVHCIIQEWIRVKLDSPQGRDNCRAGIIAAFIAANNLKVNSRQTSGGRNQFNCLVNGFKLFKCNRLNEVNQNKGKNSSGVLT